VALVCKTWKRLEREYPHQPTRLKYGGRYFVVRAALLWLLRDTSKLHTVTVRSNRLSSNRLRSTDAEQEERECSQLLFTQLAAKAPALKILDLASHYLSLRTEFRLMPLLGGMTQLENLSLLPPVLWKYSNEDVPSLTQLSNLRNLKVALCLKH
jgi:hypothetical protein